MAKIAKVQPVPACPRFRSCALRAGDTLVVVPIDRLARPLSRLLEIIKRLEAKAAHFRSLQDPTDTPSPQGKFTLQVLGAGLHPGQQGRRHGAVVARGDSRRVQASAGNQPPWSLRVDGGVASTFERQPCGQPVQRRRDTGCARLRRSECAEVRSSDAGLCTVETRLPDVRTGTSAPEWCKGLEADFDHDTSQGRTHGPSSQCPW